MKTSNRLLESPLARLKNLQEVPAEKQAAIEKHFTLNYVQRMKKHHHEALRRAEKARDVVLF